MKKKIKMLTLLVCAFLLMAIPAAYAQAAPAVVNGSSVQQTSGGIYVYGQDGQLVKGKNYTIVRVGSDLYAADKNGKAVTKQWISIGSKNKPFLYCARANGKLYAGVKSEEITFTADGYAKMDTAYYLKVRCMSIVESVAGNKKTKAKKLKAVWSYITNSKRFKYSGGTNVNMSSSDWYVKCALDFFKKNKGDCRSFACAFAALAKEIGYEPRLEYGKARQPGKNKAYRHMWVVINKKYYDPSRALRNILGKSYKHGYGMKSYKLIDRSKKIRKWTFQQKAV